MPAKRAKGWGQAETTKKTPDRTVRRLGDDSVIVDRPKNRILVLIIATLLVGVASGCTLVGANRGDGITPLTAQELDYFNGDAFFNGESMNIRNQFLSSCYDTPATIDLYELFYCGSTPREYPNEAETAALLAQYGWPGEPPCGCDKITRAYMDSVLIEHTGLALADTEQIGLDKFTYLKDYDAYYHYHGDTNYRPHVAFSRGEREGDILRLFYTDEFMGDGDKVLTLRVKDDRYLFVSNLKAAR
ncbi:MAG: hypothetical protein ACM3XN_07095 [Chloroflexota bacterium]